MSHNLKIFLLSFLLSLPFWVGANALSSYTTDFFTWHAMATNPHVLAAQMAEQKLTSELVEQRPILRKNAPHLDLRAKSALAVFVDGEGKKKILLEKNSDTSLPIASLTKLMTALVALDEYPPDQKITITRAILAEEGANGFLRVEDLFTVRDLLYSLLIESSNDAAAALAEPVGRKAFVARMNQESESLNLQNTSFVNPTGLDPDNAEHPGNRSTAQDLFELTMHARQTYPQISNILGLREFDLYDLRGGFHHTIVNTNELLYDTSWDVPVLGGKTGWTPLAQGCLLLITESPAQKGIVVTILLGSPDRFGEMKNVVNWLNQSHRW